jgi:WD40 repeat protein
LQPDPTTSPETSGRSSSTARQPPRRGRELRDARDHAEAARRLAETAREQAEASARRAEGLRLAADSELALRSSRADISVALALGAETLLTEPTLQGDLALRRVLRLHPRTLARLDHDDWVRAVAFAPDGTRVATASNDGSARVFEATPDRLLERVLAVMTRPLDPTELRRYSLSPNCRHVQHWEHQRSGAGTTDAPRDA